ncbi:MAG TPA: DUF2950 domain-containing protein [Terriglobia bacterium]|nr:DUF2950 domain-containing protein [Terriglobia bacterium]
MKPRLLYVAATLLLTACTQQEGTTSSSTDFATPEEAVTALTAALEKHDVAELGRIFGPGTEELLSSGDQVEDQATREAFLNRLKAGHQLVSGGPTDLMLLVGDDNLPLPIPLVKEGDRWRFDGAAGADKLVRSRIGGNELRTIDVMYGYVAAQRQYASQGRDGAPAGIYAQRLRSEPGKHNGLYWEARDGEQESPAGPFLAHAAAEGYGGGAKVEQTPYHGYLFRPLLSQGAAAAGGARNYLVNGKLTGGFALIAYPADYGASGIMTFIVNQDGLVWQRDLGDTTEAEAAAIQQYNPDSTWTPIPAEQ